MSLWWLGPPAEGLHLEKPVAPRPEERVPRLIRAVATTQTFVAVAAGSAHVMALTIDGKLFGWGWNAYGQCGIGEDLRPIAAPRSIGRLSGRLVAAVACGAAHTVAIVRESLSNKDECCNIYSWGAHVSGQLGHDESVIAASKAKKHTPGVYSTEATFTTTAPFLVEGLHGMGGTVADFGDGSGTLGVNDSNGVRLTQPLSCGLAHTAIIAKSGALWTFGLNKHGQCGQQRVGGVVTPAMVAGLAPKRAKAVACGASHTLVVTDQGTLYAFGLNATGQLGDGTSHQHPVLTPMPVPLPTGTLVRSVACGEEFSACVTEHGKLLTWGWGGMGQLGHGGDGSIRMPRIVAIRETIADLSAGGGQVYARTATDGLMTWGFPGTRAQYLEQQTQQTAFQHQQAAILAGEIPPDQNPAGYVKDGSTVVDFGKSDWGIGPDLTPRAIELVGNEYKRVSIAGQDVAPLRARALAAGRHFGVIIGEPINPMPEADAAYLIQMCAAAACPRYLTISYRLPYLLPSTPMLPLCSLYIYARPDSLLKHSQNHGVLASSPGFAAAPFAGRQGAGITCKSAKRRRLQFC